MKIAKGDKVRFLNDVGGGIVTRIEGGKKVYVIDEDGFEIPALISEVVLVEKYESVVEKETFSADKEDVFEEIDFKESEEEGDPNLLIAFVKNENLEANVDMYLINDSNFFVFYVVSREDGGKLETMFSGSLEPNTKILLDSVTINYIDDTPLTAQCILLRKKYSYHKKDPVDVRIKIKGAQLMKESTYLKNAFFDQKAFLYYIVKDEVKRKLDEVADKDIKNTLTNKVVENDSVFKSPRQNIKEILEIDLHINELLDDVRGLSNKDMLDYQLEKFHEVLRQNAKNKNKKIVFIHGKGNGVLKSEILKALKHQYKSLKYQDASFREYGFGATMVII